MKSAQVWPHAMLIVVPLMLVGIQLCADACNGIIIAMQAIAVSLSKVSLIKCVSVNVGCPKGKQSLTEEQNTDFIRDSSRRITGMYKYCGQFKGHVSTPLKVNSATNRR